MREIQVSEETYEKIKEQLGEDIIEDVESYKDLVGKQYFFRGVTYHSVGKVDKIVGKFLQLSSASWIPDSGRFMQAMKTGIFKEVEPVGLMYVNIDAVVDFFPAKYKLPQEQK